MFPPVQSIVGYVDPVRLADIHAVALVCGCIGTVEENMHPVNPGEDQVVFPGALILNDSQRGLGPGSTAIIGVGIGHSIHAPPVGRLVPHPNPLSFLEDGLIAAHEEVLPGMLLEEQLLPGHSGTVDNQGDILGLFDEASVEEYLLIGTHLQRLRDCLMDRYQEVEQEEHGVSLVPCSRGKRT